MSQHQRYGRGGGPGQQGDPRPAVSLSDDEARRIIVDGDAELLVRTARDLGPKLGVNMSQLRRFFGEVKRIEMGWDQDEERARRRAVLLEPRLAYQRKREGAVANLERVIVKLLPYATQSKEHFQRFVEFYEALIAYSPDKGGDRR